MTITYWRGSISFSQGYLPSDDVLRISRVARHIFLVFKGPKNPIITISWPHFKFTIYKANMPRNPEYDYWISRRLIWTMCEHHYNSATVRIISSICIQLLQQYGVAFASCNRMSERHTGMFEMNLMRKVAVTSVHCIFFTCTIITCCKIFVLQWIINDIYQQINMKSWLSLQCLLDMTEGILGTTCWEHLPLGIQCALGVTYRVVCTGAIPWYLYDVLPLVAQRWNQWTVKCGESLPR